MKTILIADEDDRIKNLVRLIFSENIGYRVITVSNGADAILRTREIIPDIVFVDFSLSNQNGHRVLREIKSDSALRNTAVLLLTSAFVPFNSRGPEAHADDTVMKPFEIGEIMNKVEALLSRFEKQEAKPGSFVEFEEASDRESIGQSERENLEGFHKTSQLHLKNLKTPVEKIKAESVDWVLILLRRFTDSLRSYKKLFTRYIEELKSRAEKIREKRTGFYIRIRGKPFKVAASNSRKRYYSTIVAGLGAALLITTLIVFAGMKEGNDSPPPDSQIFGESARPVYNKGLQETDKKTRFLTVNDKTRKADG